MAVLVTAIHANRLHDSFPQEGTDRVISSTGRMRPGVDARDKRGHDGVVNLRSEPYS
jgi:hypothetical protein